MPGGRIRYTWIEEPPFYWTILGYALAANIAASLVLLSTIERWARSLPDASHPVELRMRFGHSYYLSSGLGWYMNHDIWITFGLLGLLALVMIIHHDKIERVR